MNFQIRIFHWPINWWKKILTVHLNVFKCSISNLPMWKLSMISFFTKRITVGNVLLILHLMWVNSMTINKWHFNCCNCWPNDHTGWTNVLNYFHRETSKRPLFWVNTVKHMTFKVSTIFCPFQWMFMMMEMCWKSLACAVSSIFTAKFDLIVSHKLISVFY